MQLDRVEPVFVSLDPVLVHAQKVVADGFDAHVEVANDFCLDLIDPIFYCFKPFLNPAETLGERVGVR